MSVEKTKNLFKFHRTNILIFAAIIIGIICGNCSIAPIDTLALFISKLFIKFLKLLSLPMIFLSIVSTLSGMENPKEAGAIGRKVLKYTILTTVIASTISLVLFLLIKPAQNAIHLTGKANLPTFGKMSFLDHVLEVIPDNFITPFSQGNVINIFVLGIIIGLATLFLPKENKNGLHMVFNSLFQVIMKITMVIVKVLPLGIWAFVAILMKDIRTESNFEIKKILLYLLCVVGSNFIQAFIVLPLFLKIKKEKPMNIFKKMSSALTLAFFSKSTGATLPVTMKCAEENLNIDKKVSRFVLPLCGTINMNACASFILTTVLFVSTMNGKVFSSWELVAWIFISTLGAMGNAAVPMGCYFVATSFLSGLNVPIQLMAVILPFYSILDMFETALNVWSDSCITVVTDNELREEARQKQATYKSVRKTA